MASHSPQPLSHAAIWHIPAMQVSVALSRSQTTPQPPQLVNVDSRSTSQPLPELPSQSPSPAPQGVTPQMLLTQYGVPPVDGHTLLHAAQWFTLFVVFVSQPFSGL